MALEIADTANAHVRGMAARPFAMNLAAKPNPDNWLDFENIIR